MAERVHPKKCPKCKSGRVSIRGSKFMCLRCNYENDLNLDRPVQTLNFKKQS